RDRAYRFSTQTLHRRLASPTAWDQFRKRAGGHFTPRGGDRTNRYTSERVRITSVSANKSSGHWRNSSVIGVATTACQVETASATATSSQSVECQAASNPWQWSE